MNRKQELPLRKIEQHYPHQWVLVEETAWDNRGNPVRGIVRAHSLQREDLSEPLHELHRRASLKTFIFYTGEALPENVTLVL